jgi:hypothetical protein
MSISEVSSQSTLLTMSYLDVDSIGSGSLTNRPFSEKYREKYKERSYIYEDWLKYVKSSISSMKNDIEFKIVECKSNQKNTEKLIDEIKESHEEFKKTYSCLTLYLE